MTINAHTYAVGANSQAEHFRAPNAIAQFLTNDTGEHCNTYNMPKLTRDSWTIEPSDTKYFDYFEQALLNHILGAQNLADNHGHATYFTPLNLADIEGSVRPGVVEHGARITIPCGAAKNTKLADSLYWYDSSALYVNLFTPSVLDWKQHNVKITQTPTFPVGDMTTLTVSGSGDWAMCVRIPAWTYGATIFVNGQFAGVDAWPGSYAEISRVWNSGDTITIKLPRRLEKVVANNDANVAAIAYGPVILSGNYGQAALTTMPELALNSVRRTNNSTLGFTATADGKAVDLSPIYDAQGFNYIVYWEFSGQLPSN